MEILSEKSFTLDKAKIKENALNDLYIIYRNDFQDVFQNFLVNKYYLETYSDYLNKKVKTPV